MKYENFYIVGKGGVGKDAYIIMEEINRVHPGTFDFISFIDMEDGKLSIRSEEIEVKSERSFFESAVNKKVNILIATGYPKVKEKIFNKYKGLNVNFPNLIHPNSSLNGLDLSSTIGNIIAEGVIMSVNCRIANFNLIHLNCTIGHDTVIGEFNVINPAANISGDCVIGNRNVIGTNSTVIQGKSIGNNNVISAAAFLARDIEDNNLVVGNPGKLIKTKA